MEIVLDNGFKKRRVKFKTGNIVSIQSSEIKNILLNLKRDYDFVYIDNINLYFIGKTVFDELEKYVLNIDYSFLEEIINIFEFGERFLEKKVCELSYTEKLYLNIIRNILTLKKVVIFNDLFSYIDNFNQKKLIKLFSFLKEKDYILIISSKDVNYLYKTADYSVVWNKKFFEFDTTDNIYTNVSLLIENKLAVPVLPLITYKAKVEKDVKLFYSKDVRDIIKDIYKHV